MENKRLDWLLRDLKPIRDLGGNLQIINKKKTHCYNYNSENKVSKGPKDASCILV